MRSLAFKNHYHSMLILDQFSSLFDNHSKSKKNYNCLIEVI